MDPKRESRMTPEAKARQQIDLKLQQEIIEHLECCLVLLQRCVDWVTKQINPQTSSRTTGSNLRGL
jgi:hypothetical protein